MNKRNIEDIAYILKKRKNEGGNKPIILLGAGASASAGIPLADQIIEDIKEKFKDKPSIKRLKEDEKNNYYKLMAALSAQERRKLFADYINSDKVRLNITYIYLAQLLNEEYIDYILTVNFDDLMLKAAAMFNFIPPVYDVSILNDFTTTNFYEKSVTYLHGQHHGQWLLNAEGELQKVSKAVPKIFERICPNRTWIVIGYSGEDEILSEISKIGSFEDELYWIGYKENMPNEKVMNTLLNDYSKNSYLVSGYDSDTFLLELHSRLKLNTPDLFNKPFSFLLNMMDKVKDIDNGQVMDGKHKELYSNISDRMEISKKQVRKAKEEYENKVSVESLRKYIIEARLKNDFSDEKSSEINQKIRYLKYYECNKEYVDYLTYWGEHLLNDEENKENILKSIEVLYQALSISPNNFILYGNLSNSYSALAILEQNEVAFNSAIEHFQKAEQLNPRSYHLFTNWGNSIRSFASKINDEKLLVTCYDKFLASEKINDKNWRNDYLWGNALIDEYKLTGVDSLIKHGIDKYKKAASLSNEPTDIYINWGYALSLFADTNEQVLIHEEALEKFEKALYYEKNNIKALINSGISNTKLGIKVSNTSRFEKAFYFFEKAIEIEPKNYYAYDCWVSNALHYCYLLNENDKIKLLEETLEYAKLVYEVGFKVYNLACYHSQIKDKSEALKYLEETLVKKEVTLEHINKDKDWNNLREDEDFKKLLEKYKN